MSTLKYSHVENRDFPVVPIKQNPRTLTLTKSQTRFPNPTNVLYNRQLTTTHKQQTSQQHNLFIVKIIAM